MSRLSLWKDDSRRYLSAAIDLAYAQLAGTMGDFGQSVPDLDQAREALGKLRARLNEPPAVEVVAQRFGLSGFEQGVLLICAGVEFSPSFGAWMRRATGRDDVCATFGVALLGLADFSQPCWDALAPGAPLRRWQLVQVEPSATLTTSPLRIDERILHFMAGVDSLGASLESLLEAVPFAGEISESNAALAERVAMALKGAISDGTLPAVQITGVSRQARLEVAATAASMLGCLLYTLDADDIPAEANARQQLAILWGREAILGGRALAVEVDDTRPGVGERVGKFLRRLGRWVLVPLFVLGRESMNLGDLRAQRYEVARPSIDERRRVWRDALGPRAGAIGRELDSIISQFDLDASAVRAVSARAQSECGDDPPPEQLAAYLWTACVRQGRAHLEELAYRIDVKAGWDDLVLPAAHKDMLRTIAAHVGGRARVYQDWGFAQKSSRGLGIAAIFAGESGTGKTMAAEVLAGVLNLDLFRIDLSSVVSKYIGETEKNLRRIFDAAEGVGAILLFDEADALFGKRSEVKDSHDRYANLEVSYLLQRMEEYRGLAILTTNLKDSIDSAFSRRVRFIVDFPFPDAEQRAEIWRRAFPAATPSEPLDIAQLARLNVTGGNIRNIALNAAFLAADAGDPVCMEHVIRAARAEYAKRGKHLSAAELKGGR